MKRFTIGVVSVVLMLVVACGRVSPLPVEPPASKPVAEPQSSPVPTLVAAYEIIVVPFADVAPLQCVDDTIYMVVWKEEATAPGSAKVVSYNIRSGEIKIVYDPPQRAEINTLQVNSQWLVFRETSLEGRIVIINRQSGEQRTLPDTENHGMLPYLFEDCVAAIDSGRNVVLFDLLAGTQESIGTINAPGAYNAWVHISQGRVLWSDHIDGKGYIFVYDPQTRQLSTYQPPCNYPTFAKMAQDLIYFYLLQDGIRWGPGYFGVMNTTTGVYAEVEPRMHPFRVSEDTLAYVSSSGSLVVFGHDNLKSPIAIPELTVNGYPYYSADGRLLVRLGEQTPGETRIAVISFR